MQIDRRTLLAGGMATLASAPALAQRKRSAGDWYDNRDGTADLYAVIEAFDGVTDSIHPMTSFGLATAPGRRWSGPG